MKVSLGGGVGGESKKPGGDSRDTHRGHAAWRKGKITQAKERSC